MKHLVPTLAALALAGVASSPLSAASIKDEGAGLTLAIKGQLQIRASLLANGTYSDTTSGGSPTGAAGSPFWYQGGDPRRYAATPTSTTAAAGAEVPYYTNGNGTLILNNAPTTVAQYNALAASMWPMMPNLGVFMQAPTAAGYTAAPVFIKNGQSYDPLRGMAGEAEKARFSVRRGRLAFDAKYGDGWFGTMVFSFDNIDTTGYGTGGTGAGRGVGLYYAYAGKEITAGDLKHTFSAGLNKPYTFESSYSSSSYMLATWNPAAALVDQNRGVGIYYKLAGSFFNVATSFMNNTTAAATANASTNNAILNEAERGNSANLRLEFSPGKAMKPKNNQESFLGAEGTEVMIGLDWIREWNAQVAYSNAWGAYNFVPPYAINAAGTQYTQYTQATMPVPPGMGSNPVAAYWPTNPYYGAWYDRDSTTWGPDMLVHMNALTMVAAYKYRVTAWDSQSDIGGMPVDPTDLHSSVWTIGGAWAIPAAGYVFEPALRYSRIDMDTRRDEFANYAAGGPDAGLALPGPSPWASNRNDTSNSGDLVEMGLNWYIKGHGNKLQLTYTNWRAEEGVGRASMFILQHQLAF